MSYPRNDGRRRKFWTGKVNDSDEATRSYLNAEQGKLRVFRCPECGVRVAQEADVCLRPSLERGQLAATFTRTFNLVRVESSVCCCRCGVHLFPFDEKDPAMLTLPLYWEGNRVFQKTALRCTVVLDMGALGGMFQTDNGAPRFNDVENGHSRCFMEKVQNLQVLLDAQLQNTEIQTKVLVRYGVFPEHRQDDWEGKTNLNHYRVLYRNAGAKFHLMPFPETVKTLEELPAQDLGVYFLWDMNDGDFNFWTDFNAYYTEPAFLGLWMACGGNMLFGNWHFPKTRGDEIEEASGEPDIEDIATRFENATGRNAQPAFAQLVRGSHYLGYWSSEDPKPPQYVYEKVAMAADYRLLYPRWQFLRDFPPSQFDNPARRQKREPYALKAKDAVVQVFRPDGQAEPSTMWTR